MSTLRCRLGWHRLRWFRQPDDSWRPECSRCHGVALWWLVEREANR